MQRRILRFIWETVTIRFGLLMVILALMLAIGKKRHGFFLQTPLIEGLAGAGLILVGLWGGMAMFGAPPSNLKNQRGGRVVSCDGRGTAAGSDI